MPVKIVTRARSNMARDKSYRASAKATFPTLNKGLGPDRMTIITQRLLNGETAKSVAKTIKLDWKLFKDTKLAALTLMLTRYRATEITGKLLFLTSKDNPVKALSLFAEKVDVLDNLTRLVEMQQTRVSKAFEAEKKFDGTVAPLTRMLKFEMQLLGNLYKQLSDLQMDLGLLRKVPVKYQLEATASRTQRALEDAMAKNRRVDEALSKAYQVLEGRFTTVDETAVKH